MCGCVALRPCVQMCLLLELRSDGVTGLFGDISIRRDIILQQVVIKPSDSRACEGSANPLTLSEKVCRSIIKNNLNYCVLFNVIFDTSNV